REHRIAGIVDGERQVRRVAGRYEPEVKGMRSRDARRDIRHEAEPLELHVVHASAVYVAEFEPGPRGGETGRETRYLPRIQVVGRRTEDRELALGARLQGSRDVGRSDIGEMKNAVGALSDFHLAEV